MPGLVLTAALVFLPLVTSVWQAFSVVEGGQHAFGWIGDNPVYLRIMWRTIKFSALVALCCLVIGYPYAYLVATTSERARSVLLLLVVLPFWISMLVRIFAWFIALQPSSVLPDALARVGVHHELLGSSTGVMVTMVQLLIPFMLLPLISNMRGIDTALMQAAASLGASPVKQFLTVFLPLSLPGVSAGLLLVFISSLGFYLAPALIGSPTNALLAQSIYQQVGQLLNFGRGSALATMLLVATFLCLILFMLLRKLGHALSRRI